ncbi:hypothetical protein TNCV_3471321 [Trichonephila clavipes]|nr:hypothetical protein TNCV_3471321 [Trichonephila clavipes]
MIEYCVVNLESLRSTALGPTPPCSHGTMLCLRGFTRIFDPTTKICSGGGYSWARALTYALHRYPPVRREECQLRCRLRHLTMLQNYVVRGQKSLCS